MDRKLATPGILSVAGILLSAVAAFISHQDVPNPVKDASLGVCIVAASICAIWGVQALGRRVWRAGSRRREAKQREAKKTAQEAEVLSAARAVSERMTFQFAITILALLLLMYVLRTLPPQFVDRF